MKGECWSFACLYVFFSCTGPLVYTFLHSIPLLMFRSCLRLSSSLSLLTYLLTSISTLKCDVSNPCFSCSLLSNSHFLRIHYITLPRAPIHLRYHPISINILTDGRNTPRTKKRESQTKNIEWRDKKASEIIYII